MSLVSKFQSIAANPAMLGAYSRWAGAKLFTGNPPRLSLPGGVGIGEWLSFSEYWSLQDIVPKPERLLIEQCLASQRNGGGVAIDIGANVGAFTCLIASMGQVVHAFEPIPETFCRFKKNVRFNGLQDRVRLNCFAIGKDHGLVPFHVDENSPATSQMAFSRDSSSQTTCMQSIAAMSLDQYCDAQHIEFVDFLKIDVEGMEPYVLQGAKRLFSQRRIAATLIEVCPVNLRAVGLSPAALYHEFEAVDHSPHSLREDGKPGPKLSLAEIESTSLANVVLLANS